MEITKLEILQFYVHYSENIVSFLRKFSSITYNDSYQGERIPSTNSHTSSVVYRNTAGTTTCIFNVLRLARLRFRIRFYS